VELVSDKKSKRAGSAPGELGALVNGLLTEQGCITRNMADAIAFCPPLIITESEVDQMVGCLARALDLAASRLGLA
jgi:4-aminobutyrate---pyruvate transaminase